MTKPIRILIVEDLEDDPLLVIRHLKRGGYNPAFERVEIPEGMKASFQKQS